MISLFTCIWVIIDIYLDVAINCAIVERVFNYVSTWWYRGTTKD